MKDNFSLQADKYAKYRPGYPPELFEFILRQVSGRDQAWDCATGNGQTAKELGRHFKTVHATDISQKQLDLAPVVDKIIYSVQAAEQTNFPENSFDLVTVSQSLHWFKFDQFFAEVNRVTKPGGWLSAWMYSLPVISPEIDKLVSEQFYARLLGNYWDYERKHVDNNYSRISFPFREIDCPRFSIRLEWSAEDLEGYINSWSALQKFIAIKGYNPVPELIRDVILLWETEKRKIVFPVVMRMGQIEK